MGPWCWLNDSIYLDTNFKNIGINGITEPLYNIDVSDGMRINANNTRILISSLYYTTVAQMITVQQRAISLGSVYIMMILMPMEPCSVIKEAVQ